MIFISGHEDECVSAIREMYSLLLKHLEATPNAECALVDVLVDLLHSSLLPLLVGTQRVLSYASIVHECEYC